MSPTITEPTFDPWDPSPPPSSPIASSPSADTAIVLTGAVAQGAFAAGALDVLARQAGDHRITRIVATSAGALSATLLAAGVRSGRLHEATAALVDYWTHSATWGNALALSPRDILHRRGVSSSRKVHGIVREAIARFAPGAQQPIDLRLVVTALGGDPSPRERASTFESVLSFSGPDFDIAEGRERIATAATAAAAFPGLYAPVHVPGLGPCLDGGAVNNAPIAHALDGCALRRIVVISNTPSLVDAPPLRGISLVEHLAEVLIHERLYRDLRAARRRNGQLGALHQLGKTGTLAPHQLSAVRDALGWQNARRLELVEIRPAVALRGGAFTALGDRGLRSEYIAEGRRAAEQTFAALSDATIERADRTTHPTPASRRSR